MAQSIGRFEIRRELGRGAQSVVYLAWDPQLQREVAIKTMHFSPRDAQAGVTTAALLAESRTVSKLRHPNVVPIFDAGEEKGDPYLVFEYVEGRSLDQVLKAEGPIEPLRAAELMRQVADALGEAHALGIIHRDLKPSNILLDGRGTARVMDFGIAMRVEDAGAQNEQGFSGTPSYMAPEYVHHKIISGQSDIYAAGLIFIEMLTGRRVVTGERIEHILYRVAHEAVELPPGIGQDERLRDILAKATAKNPGLRFASAVQLREALEAYLGIGGTVALSPQEVEARKQSTLDFLLRRMKHKTDFPALSDSVAAINKLTHSDKESINTLSNTILKDYALTNKILRLVNSAYYRQSGGGSISTVSRAVIVLGFDVIRNIAITVLLFEHLENKGNARELKEAFLRANLAGLVARDASKKFMAREAEEAFICSLFHRLGQLLAQYYFAEEVEEIRKLVLQKKLSEEMAATRVLGISFEDLGIGIARIWGFPGSIVGSMRHLPDGPIRKPATHEESLRVVAGFSNELCDMIAAHAPEHRGREMKALTDRFGASMQLSDRQLKEVLDESVEELAQVAAILKVNLKQSPFARQLRIWAGGVESGVEVGNDDTAMAQTLLGDSQPELAADSETEAQALPDQAESVLTAGIQDISNSLIEDFALNDVLRIILETMYRAMGFKRVLLCLKDARSGEMVGRFGFGPDTAELVKSFRFPISQTPDVFQLAISKALDIIITDVDDPKIAERVPRWFRERMTAKTFVLFPLCIKGKPLALIYCDKDRAGSIAIPENELKLLKTLRNQALLAIKQSL
ncbi:MAG: HDOD domain-containing protein [Gammaproteobacteria bacterium]|nr:HDOD domain-containing protein [Gammaproteobacteria bacterium]MBU1645820.1 HDOD domain-containing protein [Gammaproteobacteria bacterium]MBU1971328.1 HDOD domain-containing protein [Gammaproteobacteria bacterium]